MREILFKGKRVDNGEWIRGDLITTPFIRNETQRNIIYVLDITKADYDCFEDLIEDNGIFEVEPETVCQYTGLTDKNGKRIFEGDIVQEYPFRAVIKFGEFENQVLKNIGFNLDWIKELSYRQDLPYWVNKIEVIGNIFDNPELIEK